MPSTLGTETVSRFKNEAEAHKLHLEFEVETGQTVKAGDQVKLANNGKIQLAATAEPLVNVIGVALKNGAAGERVTVAMRAYCTVVGEAGAASLNAGPVKMGAWNGTTGRREFATSAGATAHEKLAETVGYNLTQATSDGDEILVALI